MVNRLATYIMDKRINACIDLIIMEECKGQQQGTKKVANGASQKTNEYYSQFHTESH